MATRSLLSPLIHELLTLNPKHLNPKPIRGLKLKELDLGPGLGMYRSVDLRDCWLKSLGSFSAKGLRFED